MEHYNAIHQFKNDNISVYDLVLLMDKGEDVKNKENGVIYTPKYIADYIVKLTNPTLEETILEPSVGHGIFLFSLIDFMESKYQLNNTELKQWFESKVFANDITEKTIVELKTIITAFFEKKGIFNINMDNIFATDSLFHDYSQNTFDVVIGNPPYIRTKNLEESYLKKLRENFNSCSNGNVDIYYAFIDKFSTKSKRFSFIVPNSYINNASAKTLRGQIFGSLNKVIDFKEKLIFENARTYTSIFLIENDKPNDRIEYSNDINEASVFIEKDKMIKDIWNFSKNKFKSVVSKEEFEQLSFITPIATLRDSLYIIKHAELNNDGYYEKEHDGVKYLIEKEICVDLHKLTKLNEDSVIIRPYNGNVIMSEEYISKTFPMAYQYLLVIKDLLNQRDKGKTSKYDNWFAYGRKQGLNIKYDSNYLLVPIMTNTLLNVDLKCDSKEFLISSGFCIESQNTALLNRIKDAINSKDFFLYLESVGKAWPGKHTYYSMTSKQLKSFIFND